MALFPVLFLANYGSVREANMWLSMTNKQLPRPSKPTPLLGSAPPQQHIPDLIDNTKSGEQHP